jgi:hypothetical protein
MAWEQLNSAFTLIETMLGMGNEEIEIEKNKTEFRKNPKRGKKGAKSKKRTKIFKRGNLPPMGVILGALRAIKRGERLG